MNAHPVQTLYLLGDIGGIHLSGGVIEWLLQRRRG